MSLETFLFLPHEANYHKITINTSKCTSRTTKHHRMFLIQILMCCLHYAFPWVTRLNISISALSTFWPPVRPRGRDLFTPAVGKYFLPDSTDQSELSGTDWLRTPVAESVRKTWCDKLDKNRIRRKYRLAGGFYVCQGEAWLRHIRPL